MRSGPVQHQSWPDCHSPMASREENTRCQVHTVRSRSTSSVLKGLGARAAAEIRETADALIAFIEAEQKRDALHRKTKHEIAMKYNQQDRLGGAA